jgi:hypothetical protein
MLLVLYYTNLDSTPGVATQSHWHNLSHNSKRLTNTALTTIPCYSAVTECSQDIGTHQILSQAAVRQPSVCTNLPLYQLLLKQNSEHLNTESYSMNPTPCHIATEHSDQHLSHFILIIKYYRWTDHAVNDTHSCTHHAVISIHTLHNNSMLQMRYLLLNLFAAVSRCLIKNSLQFLCCMSNIQQFELFFFCFINPLSTFL